MICLVVIGLTVCGLMSSSVRVNAAAATAAFLLVGISFSVSWLHDTCVFRWFQVTWSLFKAWYCKQSGHPVIRLPVLPKRLWQGRHRERERETDFAVCNIMAFLLARWFAAQTISIDIIIVSINYRIDSSDPVLFWTHTKVHPQKINVFMFRRWPVQVFLSPTIAKFNAWSLLQTSLALSTRVLVAAVSVHRIWEKVGPWATFSWSTLKLYKVCMMYHESRRIMMVLVRDVIMRTQTALYVWEVMNLAADSCVA